MRRLIEQGKIKAAMLFELFDKYPNEILSLIHI